MTKIKLICQCGNSTVVQGNVLRGEYHSLVDSDWLQKAGEDAAPIRCPCPNPSVVNVVFDDEVPRL